MPTRVLLVSHVISTRFQVVFKAQKLRRLNKDIDLGPICRITDKYECFDNSAPWPWIFFSFCSMLCCCKGGSASWKTQSQRGGKPPKTKGRLVEEQYTEGRAPETEKAICKNVLGRTQAEAKAKLKEAIEMERDINTVKSKKYAVGEWMNEWFENYAKECARPLTRPTGGASTTT